MKKRPWTADDITKLKSMARRFPTKEIAAKLGRGVPATVMMAHSHRISLRLKPKQGSGQADLRMNPGAGLSNKSVLEEVD